MVLIPLFFSLIHLSSTRNVIFMVLLRSQLRLSEEKKIFEKKSCEPVPLNIEVGPSIEISKPITSMRKVLRLSLWSLISLLINHWISLWGWFWALTLISCKYCSWDVELTVPCVAGNGDDRYTCTPAGAKEETSQGTFAHHNPYFLIWLILTLILHKCISL